MNELILLGNLESKTDKIHQWSSLYSTGGAAPCMTTSIYKFPPIILVKKDKHDRSNNK